MKTSIDELLTLLEEQADNCRRTLVVRMVGKRDVRITISSFVECNELEEADGEDANEAASKLIDKRLP